MAEESKILERVVEPIVVEGEVDQEEPKSQSLSLRRHGFSAEERKQHLLNDSRLTEVQPHQVMCGLCKSWVRLHNIREYDTYNWRRHAERCEINSVMPEGSVRKRRRTTVCASSLDGLDRSTQASECVHYCAFRLLTNTAI